MTKEYVLKEIDSLIADYKEMQLKAMSNNEEERVIQFDGSMIALNILKERIEARE